MISYWCQRRRLSHFYAVRNKGCQLKDSISLITPGMFQVARKCIVYSSKIMQSVEERCCDEKMLQLMFQTFGLFLCDQILCLHIRMYTCPSCDLLEFCRGLLIKAHSVREEISQNRPLPLKNIFSRVACSFRKYLSEWTTTSINVAITYISYCL